MGLGGSGTWDTSVSNWWDTATNDMAEMVAPDQAIFSGIYPTLGIPTLNTVTLSGGITANRLTLNRSGYSLTGSSLTLAGATPTLHANLGESATINNQILGTAGLTKTGGGSIRLTDNTNNYTGITTISNGSLIITNQAQLGSDTSAVVVTGFNPVPTSTNLRGFGGGSLVLDGTGGAISFTRDLSLQGQGPIADRGAAVLQPWKQCLSGTVTTGQPFSGTNLNTRLTWQMAP